MSARDWLLPAASVPFVTLAAAPFVIWGALRVRRAWRRAGRLHRRITGEEAPRPPLSTLAPAIAAGIAAAIKGLGDDALALLCDPCNGRPGDRCRCPSKESCPNPKCGAPDTRITGWTAAEIAYLRGETEELPK